MTFALLALIHLGAEGLHSLFIGAILFKRLPVAFSYGLACTLAWKPLPGWGRFQRELGCEAGHPSTKLKIET